MRVSKFMIVPLNYNYKSVYMSKKDRLLDEIELIH